MATLNRDLSNTNTTIGKGPDLNNVLGKAVADSANTGNKDLDKAIGNLAANLAAGGIGAVVGGGSGAATAANAERFNRQLHEIDQEQLKRLAAIAAEQQLKNPDGSVVTSVDIANQLAQMDMRAAGSVDAAGNRMAAGKMPDDGTSWQAYGTNQAGAPVWTQVLPLASPEVQEFIVKNTGYENWSPLYTSSTKLPTKGLRGPDFINFQLDYYVGSLWGTFSRDGNSFIGYGVNKAAPSAMNVAASVQFGWLNQLLIRPGDTNSFLSGYAGSGMAAFAGVGGGIVYSPGNATATIIGIGGGANLGGARNPASGSVGFSKDQGKTRVGW